MSSDGSSAKDDRRFVPAFCLSPTLTNDGHSHTPAWSPDGRRILFVHDSTLQTKPAYREEKEFESYHSVELYVMDKDGGTVISFVAWNQ